MDAPSDASDARVEGVASTTAAGGPVSGPTDKKAENTPVRGDFVVIGFVWAILNFFASFVLVWVAEELYKVLELSWLDDLHIK